MPDLTAKARANLEAGATSGPGTDVCAKCGGAKEATRLNSAQCRRCSRNGVVVTSIKVDVLDEVLAALKAEAPNGDVGAFVATLLRKRHDRLAPKRAAATAAEQFPETST